MQSVDYHGDKLENSYLPIDGWPSKRVINKGRRMEQFTLSETSSRVSKRGLKRRKGQNRNGSAPQ